VTENSDEQARTIAELRDCFRGLQGQLGARGEALMVVSSGVVVVKERYADLATTGSALATGVVDEHGVRSLYALAHEHVHWMQVLTSRFVLEIAFEFFNLSSVTAAHRRRNRAEAEWLPDILHSYRELQRRLTATEGDCFSTLQVLETQAVLEGFRGMASRHIPDGLKRVLHLAHGSDPTYAQVVETALSRYGFDLTLEVVPRLCWLALDARTPGAWLSNVFDKLEPEELARMANLSAIQTCSAFAKVPEVMAESWRRRMPAIKNHPLYLVLTRYFDVLETQTDVEACLQRAMHPGRKPPHERHGLGDMAPPVTVFADDVVVMNGPYRNEGWEEAEPLLRSSAMMLSTLAWLDTHACSAPTA